MSELQPFMGDAFASCFAQPRGRSPQPGLLVAPGAEPVKAAPPGPPTAGPDGPTLTEPTPSAEQSHRSAGKALPTRQQQPIIESAPPLSFLPPDHHSTPGAQPRASSRWARHAAAELTPDAIEQIAQRVAQLLRHDTAPDAPTGLMDAGQLARQLGLTRAWVYQHAAELGAIRVGTGPRARLRFDPNTVTAVLNSQPRQPPSAGRTPSAPRLRPSAIPNTTVPLLPVRPRRVRAIVSRLRVSRRSRGW